MKNEKRGVKRRITRVILYAVLAAIAILSFASCDTSTEHSCAFGGEKIDSSNKNSMITAMNASLNEVNDVKFYYLDVDMSESIVIPEGRYVGICLNGKKFTSSVTIRDTDGDPTNNVGGVYTFNCGIHGIHGDKRFISVDQDILDFFAAAPKVYDKLLQMTSSKINIALRENVTIDVNAFTIPEGATLTLCTNGYSSGLSSADKVALMKNGGVFITFDCNADYYHECIHLPDDVHVITQSDLEFMQTLLASVTEGTVYVYLAEDIEWPGTLAVNKNVNLVVCLNGFKATGDYVCETENTGNIYMIDCSNHLCEGICVTGKALAITEDSIVHFENVFSAVADVNSPYTVYAVLEEDIDVPVFDGIDLRVCLNGYKVRNSVTKTSQDGTGVVGSVTYYNCASRHVCGVSELIGLYSDPIFVNNVEALNTKLGSIQADATFDASDVYFYSLTSDISGVGTVSAPSGSIVGICLNGFSADGVTFGDNVYTYECSEQYCTALKATITAFDQGVFDFYATLFNMFGGTIGALQSNEHIAISEDITLKCNFEIADGYTLNFCSCGYSVTNFEKISGSVTYHDVCTPGSLDRKEFCDTCGRHAHDDTCVCEGNVSTHNCALANLAEMMIDDIPVVKAPVNERRGDIINDLLAELPPNVMYFAYLTDDLTGDDALTVPENVYLFICLNGYSMGDVTIADTKNIFVFECGNSYCKVLEETMVTLDQNAFDLIATTSGLDAFGSSYYFALGSDITVPASRLVLSEGTTITVCTNGYSFNIVDAESTEGYDPSKIKVHNCTKDTCSDCGTAENDWIPFNYSTYKAITNKEGVVTLPAGSHFFYLENDFQLTAQLTVPAGVDLHICLNGYTLYSAYIWSDSNTRGGGYPENLAMGLAGIEEGATLNVHDCSPGMTGGVSLRYLRADQDGDGKQEIIISYSSDDEDNSIAAQLGQNLGQAINAAFANVAINYGTVNVYGGSYNAMIAFINVENGVTNIYSGKVNAMFVGVLQIASENENAELTNPSTYLGDDVIVSAGFAGVIGVGGSAELDGATVNAGLVGVAIANTTDADSGNAHIVIDDATINAGHYDQIVNATESVWVKSGGVAADNPVVVVNSLDLNFNAAVYANVPLILDGEINTDVVSVSGTVEDGSTTVVADFIIGGNQQIHQSDDLDGEFTVAIQSGESVTVGDGERLKPANGFMTRVNFESGELEIVPIPEGYKDRANVTGMSASTAGDVRVNIYVTFDVSDLNEEEATAYLETVVFVTQYKGETVTFTIDDAETTADPYTFKFSLGTPAKDYKETIRFAFTDDSGCIKNVYEISVAKYLEQIMLNEKGDYSNKAVMLATALDNYCASAAKHFGISNTYTPEEYIAEYMATVDAEYLKDYAAVRGETAEDTKATLLGGTVLLKDTVTIRLFFKLDGVDPSSIVATVDGVEVQILESEIPSRPYYIEIKDVYAKDLDKMFEITIDGSTVNYSVMSYAYSVISRPSSYTEDMLNVVKALCLYYEAAEIYTSGDDTQEG